MTGQASADAIRILRDRGYDNLTVSGAVDILVAAGFRPSTLTAISLDDAIHEANTLRTMDAAVLQIMGERA